MSKFFQQLRKLLKQVFMWKNFCKILNGFHAINFWVFQLQDFITQPTEIIGQNCRINLPLHFHFLSNKKDWKNRCPGDAAHYNMEPLFSNNSLNSFSKLKNSTQIYCKKSRIEANGFVNSKSQLVDKLENVTLHFTDTLSSKLSLPIHKNWSYLPEETALISFRKIHNQLTLFNFKIISSSLTHLYLFYNFVFFVYRLTSGFNSQ
jgi:hypothetical protein